MKYLLSYTLFAFAILSITIGWSCYKRKDYPVLKRRLFLTFALSSTWWNFWWALLLIQTNEFYGYLCRSIGMPGVILYLVLGTFLIAQWSLPGRPDLKKHFTLFSCLGFIVLPFNILPDSCDFFMEPFGMSYKFNSGFWMEAYTVYCALVGINMFIMLSFMLSKKNKRSVRILGRYLMCCCGVILLGMILDTLCPMIGIGAFPGSTLVQFIGVIFVYRAASFEYKNNITFENITDIIIHSFTTPVIITDERGILQLANASAQEFFQLDDNFANNTEILELFNFESPYSDIPLINQQFEASSRATKRDCSITIDILYDTFHEIMGYVCVIHDITERNHLIIDLTEARILADKANESKSIFLANMSHEIRTPINAVLGMDEMILREDNLDNIRNYAQNIRTAGKTLLAIINEILDFSKIESGKMELINSNFALDSMLFDLSNSIFLRAKEKNITFKSNLDSAAPKILYGDELRVKQIVMNLLTNAVKYTEKGSVHFSMSYNKIDENKIILRFIVKDTGIGIKDADMEKIFSSFKRLDDLKNRTIEGTGLGLNIVQKLLTLMGGTIQVESEYQKGSTFTVSIPIIVMDWTPIGSIDKMDQTSSPDFEPFKSSFIAPNANILSVDDNRVNLKVFKGLLKETQIHIDAVTSGEKCLDFVKKKKYDIIFLDHMMPGMDGIETLEKLKVMDDNMCKDVPVIVLTANALSGMEEQYLAHGFNGYITKPIDYDILENTILKYLPEELVHKL